MIDKKVLSIFLILSLFCPTVWSQPGSNSLQRLLGRWLWLIRYHPEQGYALRYLIRTESSRIPNTVSLVATSFPGGTMKTGADINRISRLNWRTQPETSILVGSNGVQTDYIINENGYSSQHMTLASVPDLSEVADCLANTLIPHLPLYMNNVHSLPLMLSGLLNPAYRRGLLSAEQLGDLFFFQVVAGNNLIAHSVYEPDFNHPNHFIYSTLGDRQSDIGQAVFHSRNLTFIQLGSLAPYRLLLGIFLGWPYSGKHNGCSRSCCYSCLSLFAGDH